MRPLPTFHEEQALQAKGYRLIAGVDEVGRGPLAGPVVAAAVILPPEADLPWLTLVRDSKQLTPQRRQFLCHRIQEGAVAVGVGIIPAEEIDAKGIAAATKMAMCQAARELSPAPDFLLIDCLRLPQLPLPQKGIVHGDSLSLSIAAASIVAKVTRDNLMVELDAQYPGYGLAQHKGYATPEHLSCLRRLGPCPIHRRSFAPVWGATFRDSLRNPTASGRKKLGALGEKLAMEYLLRQGYHIIETNYRCSLGEIDVVAQRDECLVFVEVRARRSRDFGTPEESITPTKGERLIALANDYLQAHEGLPAQWRIDVVGVELTPGGKVSRIEVTENAISEPT